ncbi:alpha/beta fold hydrolase [Bradyrhizobium sp.]|uniref:alpha/beta fold hydrolase n=1 Tax=Bradyrhizobium sp. TaxID=376 RepID=UPI003C608ED1
MISIGAVVALAILALLTQVVVVVLDRAYPPLGEAVTVAGARLNVVELGPRNTTDPPLLLIHGASSNLEVMRRPLGDLLARNHRVILIDRPGHGRSTSSVDGDATPDIQARMIAEALGKLGISKVILVVHSLSGALGARMALDYSERLAGLVMLAPVTHPWRGGVGWYNKAVTTPGIGRLLAYTVTLPLGLLLVGPAARAVFLPQQMPDGFVKDTATLLLLRPREFLANARDLVTLKAAVAAQAPRYAEISVPTTIISGDVDMTVSTDIHSRPFAAAVSDARLIVLKDVGHMVQNVAPDLVISEIDAMIGRIATERASAARAATPRRPIA